MEIKPVYELTVYAQGVKKRCRKSDKVRIKVCEIELGQENNHELIDAKVKESVNKWMKTLDNNLVTVTLNYIEFEKTDSNVIIKRWLMFDKRNIRRVLNVG